MPEDPINPPTTIDIVSYEGTDYECSEDDLVTIGELLGDGILSNIPSQSDQSDSAKRRRRRWKMILDLLRAWGN